jgi:hypothetical protein
VRYIRRYTNLLQIDVLAKLHVLGVDAQDLELASRANVDLAIKSAKS